MANLGICTKCRKCVKVEPPLVDDRGRTIMMSQVWCDLQGPGIVEWDSEVTEDCPYRMEHLVTAEAVQDFSEEVARSKE
jgi:hypothetical protein